LQLCLLPCQPLTPAASEPADPPGGVARCRDRVRCGIGAYRNLANGRLARRFWCAGHGRLVIFQHGLRLVRAALTGENAIFVRW
jgi:hypothetical protein